MRTVLLGTVLGLLTAAAAGRAADDPAPPPAGPSPAVGGDIDHEPWNPPVPHANDWPYLKPLPMPTDYYGPPGEFWLRGEFFLWALKGDHPPPLATAGPAGSGAVPGQAGVVSLFGGSGPELNPYYGGRFTGGVWFESDYVVGFEGSYFFLADRAARFLDSSAGTPGAPDLGRPFLNVATGQPAAALVASAGVASGTVGARLTTEFQSAEGVLVCNVCRKPHLDVNAVAGFRYADLGGVLSVGSRTTSLATAATTTTADQLASRNHFYGGEVGARVDCRWHCLVLTLTEKLALGANTPDIVIAGGTVQTSATGTTTTTAGGLLTGPGNIGRHSDDTFALFNEFGIQAGWQISDCVQVYGGYTLVYDSSVVRPGGLVDVGVNATTRPAFAPRDTSFWAHGLNAGVEVRY